MRLNHMCNELNCCIAILRSTWVFFFKLEPTCCVAELYHCDKSSVMILVMFFKSMKTPGWRECHCFSFGFVAVLHIKLC